MSIGSYAHLQGTPAHETEGSASTWWVRAANMVAAYSEVVAGSVLERADNADEYFVWALFTPSQVTAGGDTADVPAGSVVIVPPGESSIRFPEAGSVWRGFTSLNTDLLGKAPNSHEYAEHPAGVAPVDPWPMPNEYQQRLNSLPAEQKDLAEESTRFADLCQYFSQQRMDIPASIVERVRNVSKLPVKDRIRAMKDINRELMEYLNDVGQDPGIRQ